MSLTKTQTLGLANSSVTIEKIAASANVGHTHRTNTWNSAQHGYVTTITPGNANVTINFANSNYFSITLANNITLLNPTNPTAGQSGAIFVNQDATGSRTLSFGSQWRFPGGTAPTLTTTASAHDRIDYVIEAANTIHAVASLNLTGTA